MRWWMMAGAVITLGAGIVSAIEWWPIRVRAEAVAEPQGDPSKGAYLARMGGCIACHSDFENGGTVLAGGQPLVTRFGSFVPPNITPDPEAGIGAWTFADFVTAVRHGVSPEGEPYYPAFPYTFYTKMSDVDLADLWAAIWTVPPVAEPAPENELYPPFNWRDAMKVWRSAYFEPGPAADDPEQDALWNRGAYIVEGPAHCGACHSPRNVLGARDAELALHGSEDLPNGGKSPAITEDALIEKGWTQADIVWALKTGTMPDGDTFGGSMGEVVRDGTRFLTEEDLLAIATYLLPNAEE